MLNLLSLYQWTVIAAVLAAPVLALLGIQLATRDRAMQTVCVGQGAMVGVLLGLGLFHDWEDTPAGSLALFSSGVIFSSLIYLLTDRLVARRVASKNTFFIFIFALLLAMGNLIAAVFPALESHMAQIYFGDLATLSTLNSKIVAVAAFACLVLLISSFKRISDQSFETAIYGIPPRVRKFEKRLFFFKFLSIVVLCFSVQFVGFLFTIAMLFLPTSLMSFFKTKGLYLHSVICVFLASASALAGFALSLKYTRLPTVPSIVMTLFLFSCVVIALEHFFFGLSVKQAKKEIKYEQTIDRFRAIWRRAFG